MTDPSPKVHLRLEIVGFQPDVQSAFEVIPPEIHGVERICKEQGLRGR